MTAYYNENDEQKAVCLREFIRAGLIAPGEVDERSIADVEVSDLREFTQCHFFAGFGVWSYALRLAGWPDDRPVWTGSCPCPSFSAAGKGGGFNDPRHLWPAWYRLIPESNPPTIFGEQADDAIGYGWLDLVQTDLERAGYAVGKAVLTAAGVGAPHARERLYFGAHAQTSEVRSRHGEVRMGAGKSFSDRSGNGGASRFSPNSNGRLPSHRDLQRSGEQRLLAEDCATGEHGHADSGRLAMHGRSSGMPLHAERTGEMLFGSQPISPRLEGHFGDVRDWRGPGWLDPHAARSVAEAGATRGLWRDCDWWHARDEKYRPIEPGIFPLAHGVANRVLKLRGYGDAIVPEVAAEFIQASDEAMLAGERVR